MSIINGVFYINPKMPIYYNIFLVAEYIINPLKKYQKRKPEKKMKIKLKCREPVLLPLV